MKTRIFNAFEGEGYLPEVAKILNSDGIVAIPTETVYGLAASAYSDSAIKKVFSAKGRPQDNPLIVHVSSVDMLKEIAKDIPNAAYTLAEKFWPGPLTMVLKKGENVCDSVTAGLDSVAVRLPESKTARDIINAARLPLAAPSANISGYPSPTKAEHVIADLSGKIDAVVAGEDCRVGVESTVITLVTNPPRLLRPGAVTAEQLREILPELIIDPAVLSELKSGEKAASPGMKYKHYSPRTQVVLVEADAKGFADFVNEKKNAVAVSFVEDKGIEIPNIVYGERESGEQLAHSIFSVLRDLDKSEFEIAYVHAPSKSGAHLAVYNRLIRAAGFNVIKL